VASKGAIGRQMADWRHGLDQKWATLHFGYVKVEAKGDQHIFEVQVCLHGLDPKVVRVELYANAIKGSSPVRQEMTLLHLLADEAGSYIYSATVSATRPSADYTARVLPHHENVVIPLEDSRILWQH
jgi:starch phosphorylase